MLETIVWLGTAALAGPSEGRALFEHEWTVGDALSPAGDGLGPLYNATSCASCHRLGGTGGAGDGEANVTLLPQRGVVQKNGTSKDWASYRESLFQPSHIPEFGCGTAAARFMSQFEKSFRQTPALFGASALDQVTEADLEQARVAGEAAGVSGRIARDADGRPGRFGWKGQIATITSFVEAACVNELGLGTPATPQPADPTVKPGTPPGADLSEQQLADLVAFVASLPPPAARPSEAAERGRAAFGQAGCMGYHAERLGALEGAWTDLLLHDLGFELADGGFGYGASVTVADAAEPREWRTPPLWGLAASAPYLHDGRATTLDDAIRAHGGEAGPATVAYAALDERARGDLLAFLGSLGP